MKEKLLHIKELLSYSAEQLREVTDIPQKEAMILLAHVLGCETSWLLSHSNDEISIDEHFFELLKRRVSHEPLEYILGKASFYGKEFNVDSRVLIPRPDRKSVV